LRGRLAKLAQSTPGDLPDLTADVPDPGNWSLDELCHESALAPGEQRYERLIAKLEACNAWAFSLSDSISRRYFSHAASGEHSLGA
jgi:hypothetical protein